MGLVIKIKNIQSVNNFKLFYKVGRTPGSSSSQSSLSWGTQYTGSPSVGGIFNESVTTISIDLITQGIDLNPYNKQYWFKILDVVTGSYVIENIHIHEYEFYDRCIPKCDLGGTAVFLAPTPTPTYTIDCSLDGTAVLGVAPTSTPTSTPTPTSTVNCSLDGTAVLYIATPTPTSTETPTPTPSSYVLLGPINGLSSTSLGACNNYFSSRSYYTNVNFIQSNVTYIYDSISPTLVPLDTGGQWKPLSFNGVNKYAVTTNSSGMVTNYTSC